MKFQLNIIFINNMYLSKAWLLKSNERFLNANVPLS